MAIDRKHFSDRMRLPMALALFVYGAVAINVFLAGLLLPHAGWPALSPGAALLVAIPISIPATWLAVRWVRHLIDLADSR